MGDRETVLARGRFLELVTAGEKGWEYARRVRGGSPVGIVAVTEEGEMVLITQYRVPVEAVVIEIPAGLVGDEDADEAWETAARRELLEETGYACAGIEELMIGPTSAGLTSELIRLVQATGLRKVGEATGDGEEKITVHLVKVPEVRAWLREGVRRGMLVDPKVYAGLWFVK